MTPLIGEPIRVPDSRIRFSTVCGSCKNRYQAVITLCSTECFHCKVKEEKDISQEDDVLRIAARIQYYLLLKRFETEDELVLHANENHTTLLKIIAETFRRSFACEVFDDGYVTTMNRKTGKELLVTQYRIRKNPWLLRDMAREKA